MTKIPKIPGLFHFFLLLESPESSHRIQLQNVCVLHWAGASREGLSRTVKGQHDARSTCQGWLRRRTVLDRTRARGGKGTHTGVLPLRQDRGRAPGPPGKVGTRPGCRPGSSGRWPLAQERRAARAHARPQWRPPSVRGGGISTWLAAPSHRGRQETASAALLRVPREPPERAEREQRWLRWRGVAREARARDGGAR